MQKRLFHLIFLLGIICWIYIGDIHAENYLYSKLSDQSWKLPKTQTLYNEEGKYLWIGTEKGIYRFNGYDFTFYGQNKTPDIFNGISTNHLYKDIKGNLWLLTDKGIGLYNRKEDCFERIEKIEEITGPFFTTCQLEDGILFAGRGKILRYDYAKEAFTLFKNFKEIEATYNVRYMYKADDKHIVLDYGNLIIKTDLNGHSISSIECPSLLTCMFVDANQKIWAGCYNKRLYCFNERGQKLREFSSTISDLSNEIILCMEQQDSLLWIGTDGGGINILNTHTNHIESLKHIRGEAHSFPDNSINCLYNDSQQTIWAGTVRNGIIAIRKSPIHSYTEVHENSQWGLSNSTVLSFYQDDDKDFVWIGTDGEGINKLNMKSRTFEHFPSTKGTKVFSITKFDENRLLLSLYLKGLYLFDIHTGTLSALNIRKKELINALLQSKAGINLYQFSSHQLLALTNKVYMYDKLTKITEEIPFESLKGFKIIFPIGEFNDELFMHNEAAIYKLNKAAKQIETIYEMPQGEKIKSASINLNGNIWLATDAGISYYSVTNKHLHQIQNHILGDISVIATDKNGKVWMGETGKLYVYSDLTKSLALFGQSDGVIANDYIDKAHFQTQQGDILLGGTQGLTIIDGNFKMGTGDKPYIILSEINIDDKNYNEYNLSKLSSVNVPAESKTVRIQVTTIEDDMLRPKIYKYELKGENKQIIESHSPIIELHTFDAGETSVFVSCSTRNGEWTTPTHVTTLFFMPPWYETYWFYAGCGLILIFISISIITTIFRRKENQLKLELKEKEKDVYEEKVKFLININHELRTPLTLITGPIQRILQTSSASSVTTETLQKVFRQAERMKRLLNMVLDLRKMEVGETAMNIQSVRVNEWIEEVVADFSYKDDPQGPQVQINLDTTIDSVNFDKEKCEIVLTNLLINAIKHSGNHEKILVKSEISSDHMLSISVIDEGEGLKNVNVDKLFNRFYQGNNETNGSGIGLSYAKMLVELHKGTIGGFNNSTKGATFYFKIPLNLELGEQICEKKAYLNEVFSSESNCNNTIHLQEETTTIDKSS